MTTHRFRVALTANFGTRSIIVLIRRLLALLLMAALVQLSALAPGHDHTQDGTAALHAMAVDSHDLGHVHGDHDEWHRPNQPDHDDDDLSTGFHSHLVVPFIPPSEGSLEVRRLTWAALDPPPAVAGLVSQPYAPPFRPPRAFL